MTHTLKKVVSAIAIAILSMTAFTSCGDRVEVPTAHVGFVKLKTGIQEEIKQPSTFKLPYSWTTDPQLIIVETSSFTKAEKFQLFLPKDKLKLTFDVRGIYSINGDKARDILDRIPSSNPTNHVSKIQSDMVYDIYTKQVVRTTTRSIVSKYSIQECLTNRGAISKEIMDTVVKQLKNTPVKVTMLALAEVSPPLVVITAQENAKKREIAIQEAEANKLVSLKEAEARLEVAKKQQQIDLLEAETQVLVEKKLAESVSKAFVTQRALKVMELMAKSTNKVFVLPSEAMQNPSMMLGVHQKGVE